MIKVYVAGPIGPDGSSDQLANVERGIAAGAQLLELGFAAYVPHLNYYWHRLHPRDRRSWLDHDFVWVRSCDALLRLPGHSPGADEECGVAEDEGIPVFHTVAELVGWREGIQKRLAETRA